MKRIIGFLLFTLIFTTSTYAAQKARVLFVRGDVSALLPREMDAKKVKKGDLYPEDTSILTKKRSIVRLKFDDSSVVNLGPNSKIVVSKLPKKEANIVNVLTGAIKAEVKKQSSKKTKTKLVLKTQTAVMGVRGTKFQASYSPKSKVTSLVTVEGEVVMTKTTPKLTKTESIKVIDKALDQKTKAVTVKPGKFASVVKEIKKPTKPVNIAPVQYNALAKSMKSKKRAKVVMNDASDDKDAEKKIDIKKDLIKYKAGGYVDFETGQYIEPKKTAKFHKATNTYSAKGLGKVDRQGNYKSIKKVKKTNSFWKKILPLSYTVGFNFVPFSEKYSATAGNNKMNFLSDKANYTFLTFGFQWTKKFYMSLNVGGGNFSIDDQDVPLEDHGDGADYFRLQFDYKLSEKWDLVVGTDSSSYSTSYEIYDVGNPRVVTDTDKADAIIIGAKRRHAFWEKYKMESLYLVKLIDKKRKHLGLPQDREIKSWALYADLAGSINFWKRYTFKPALFGEYAKHEATDYKANRYRIGTYLSFLTTF